MHYFINIGSNLGNRRLNLSKAMRSIAGRWGWFEMAKVIESEPWGYESENPYLNVGVTFVSNESPEEVLAELQEIERELGSGSHRNKEGEYIDRLLDIDIVAVDEQIIKTESLEVPHHALSERKFFIQPMIELAPLWKHPVTGLTPEEMMQAYESGKDKGKEEEKK